MTIIDSERRYEMEIIARDLQEGAWSAAKWARDQVVAATRADQFNKGVCGNEYAWGGKMITIEDICRANFHPTVHYNLGKHGGAYGYRCDKHPRLSFMKYTEKSKLVLWCVDGTPCSSLEHAIERLSVPVWLTAEESAVLEQIPETFVPLHLIEEVIAGEPAPGVVRHDTKHARVLAIMYLLGEKGMLEYRKSGHGNIERPTVRRRKNGNV